MAKGKKPKKVSIDKDVLSMLIEAGELRQAMWQLRADGEELDDELDAFHEADEDEAQDMVGIYEEALTKARQAYHGKKT